MSRPYKNSPHPNKEERRRHTDSCAAGQRCRNEVERHCKNVTIGADAFNFSIFRARRDFVACCGGRRSRRLWLPPPPPLLLVTVEMVGMGCDAGGAGNRESARDRRYVSILKEIPRPQLIAQELQPLPPHAHKRKASRHVGASGDSRACPRRQMLSHALYRRSIC